jgi:cytidylate kinase
MQPVAIAIDGPAASGKSSVARRIADHFGFLFVNSGAMYRAFTWWVLEHQINPEDARAVVALLQETEFECGLHDGQTVIQIKGQKVAEDLQRTEAVNGAVSAVSAIPEVRQILVAEQQRFRRMGDLVMEGRDIGTVVMPDTPYKFYLEASSEIRARRRRAQGIDDDIRARDNKDSSRETAPLRPADDARIIDTSYLSLDEVTRRVIEILEGLGVRKRQARAALPCRPSRQVPG